MIDEIFAKAVCERKIFKDPAKLSPHYIPEELPHREKESNEIATLLSPALRNEKPHNIFIYGKPGTGKTCVVKYVARKLDLASKEINKNKTNSGNVGITYINCRTSASSEYQVMLRVLESPFLTDEKIINTLQGKKIDGLPIDRLYNFLIDVVKANKINLILILDEIDIIRKLSEKDNLMYKLIRINDGVCAGGNLDGSVSIIGITNDLTFKEKLDGRTKSTLTEKYLVFKPYNADQLTTILDQRVPLAFTKDAVEPAAVRLCAAYVARDEEGDARYALRVLRDAGEIAENENRNIATTKDVEKAYSQVESNIIFEVISSLPLHLQIALYAISEAISSGVYKKLSDFPSDVLFSGEAYASYENICKKYKEKPRTMRWFREYLNDLEKMGLITLQEAGRGFRGNTTIIRLGYTASEIKEDIRKLIEKNMMS